MKDIVGAVLSSLCLCHCILTPAAILYGGVGLHGLIDEPVWVHLLLIGPVILVAVWSFPQAMRIHKHGLPSVLATLGVCLLLLSLLNHSEWELALGMVGSLTLLIAHLFNRKLLQRTQWQQEKYDHSASNS